MWVRCGWGDAWFRYTDDTREVRLSCTLHVVMLHTHTPHTACALLSNDIRMHTAVHDVFEVPCVIVWVEREALTE